ncbi:MAG: hypothetical protein GWN67_14010 [Phycisphaerae bacterium]|nr:hypothetical protein [Phycisphaerae bacterium]NIP55034.1 hypothetical protein [Phycisphaerae bacterium]NIS53744.1 hypothetical protein [Phycisphaerae bacterium]NIU11322.1 hypothetical protein [Phycisphaerae bacterium]NIU57452.1 hypothetical protein [Phycisphaerae bacterium]
MVREIKCSKNDTYVNIKNNKIVAFIIIRSEKTEKTDKYRNYIWELFADPIGKGYGSELIQEMQNREFLCLHVKKTNSVAINAYIKNKFIIVNEHPRGDKWYMKWPDK